MRLNQIHFTKSKVLKQEEIFRKINHSSNLDVNNLFYSSLFYLSLNTSPITILQL